MNENLNLVEILKDCKGIKLYSTMYGECILYDINTSHTIYPIHIKQVTGEAFDISLTKDGKYVNNTESECILFPSKENRDWSTFKISKQNITEFKTFDKVLVRDMPNDYWRIDLFSHYIENDAFPYMCLRSRFKTCISYKGNEHLLGTQLNP